MKKSFTISMASNCLRQFDKSQNWIFIQEDVQDFMVKLYEVYENYELKDGYAAFCKHLFVENFTQAVLSVVEITEENKHLLVSDYVQRNQYEAPVLMRWFPRDRINAPVAKYLDLILYAQDQKIQENQSQNQQIQPSYDYAIVSIKPIHVNYELPMEPITVMRNALGNQEGGSGIPFDRNYYLKCIEFWKKHASVK